MLETGGVEKVFTAASVADAEEVNVWAVDNSEDRAAPLVGALEGKKAAKRARSSPKRKDKMSYIYIGPSDAVSL